MASEIKVDTIVNAGGDNDTGIDLATNDQILLKVANATKLTMNSTGQTTIVGEGGTNTTSLQQGLAKCFIRTDEPGTVFTSFNVSSNIGAQFNAPVCAVVEQLRYNQSIPLSFINGYKLTNASSTVSLYASVGL